MRRQKGFTLLELMVVVAVIAVLTIIAIPSYQEYIRKGRRADAARSVGQIQLDLERWRAENPCYGQNGSAGCPNAFTESGSYPAMPTSDYYTFAIATATPTAFSATGTPKGAQSGDRCGVITSTRDTKPSWANSSCN